MYQKLLCIIFVVYSIDVKNVPEIFLKKYVRNVAERK